MAAPCAKFRVHAKLCLLLLLVCSFISSSSSSSSLNFPRRRVLEADNEEGVKVKKLKVKNDVVSEDEPVVKPKKVKSDVVSEEEPVVKPKKVKNDGDELVIKPKKVKSNEEESVIKPKKVKSDEEDPAVKPKKVKSDEEDPAVKPKKVKSDDAEPVIKPKKVKSDAVSEDELVVKPKKVKSNAVSEDEPVIKPKKVKSDAVSEEEPVAKPKKLKSDVVSEKEPKKVKGDVVFEDEPVVKPKKVKSASENEPVVKPKKVAEEKPAIQPESDAVLEAKAKTNKADSGVKEVDAKSKKKNSDDGSEIKPKKNQTKTAMEGSSSTSDPAKNKTKTGKLKQESGGKGKGSKTPKKPSWLEEDDIDIVGQMRDFPSKFPQSIIPDMERISLASKKYITRANKEMIRGIKPIVGNKYASTIASFVSFAFIVIPLLLVPLIFNRIKAYFSLQKILIFIQAYLAIYFSILCLSSLVTGIDPLKFFYATSSATYMCVMVFQILAYLLYLLMLLMYLVLVFSTENSMGAKLMGLSQTAVGFVVGLHFYMAVFHRVMLRQPPVTNWKTHGTYAVCFMALCGLAAAEKRKKTYLEEGGEEGKKN